VKRLKNKIILEIILGVLVVAVVAFSGCIEEETPAKPLETTPTWEDSESYAYTTETIVISGVDEVIEINRDNPIKLVISGMGNTVTISENTVMTEIVSSGMDNTVYISRSSTPKIIQSGMDNEIIRY